MSDVTLSAAVRQNVQQLNRVQTQIEDVQQNLSTGKDVNSALDDPQNFFAAKSLNDRSDSLLSLKDQMGQGISTIQSANEAADSMSDLIGQAEGLANQALNNLGTDEESAQTRASLAGDFNEVLSQIDRVAQDAGYAGKNLTVGSGKEFGGEQDSLRDVNQIQGLSSARVTNAQDVDTTRLEVSGNGQISANEKDVIDAEQSRGLQNLRISGLNSKQSGSFDDISISVEGGEGSDKAITVTEGDESTTLNFDRETLSARDESAFVKFSSGTAVSFDVNLDKMEGADNAGVGTSTIEKNVDVGIEARDTSGLEKSRAADNRAGDRKLADGENALQLTNSTVRFNVDSSELQKGSDFDNTISEAFGSRGDAITDIEEGSNYTYAKDTSYQLSVSRSATNPDFDPETGNFEQGYDVTLEAVDDAGSAFTVTAAQTVTAGNASNITFSDVGADTINTGTLTLDFDFDRLSSLVATSAATSGEVNDTFERSSGDIDDSDVSVNSDPSGFLNDFTTDLKFTVNATDSDSNGNITNANIFVEDGLGGVESLDIDPTSSQTETFTLSGGPNDGAEIELSFEDLNSSTSLQEGDSAEFTYSVRGEFTSPGSAEFVTREGQDNNNTAFVNTELKAPATSENDLRVDFNEERSNFINVESQNLQTNGTGLSIDEAQNNWFDRGDIERSLDQLRSAKSELESAQSTFSTNLNVIQSREEFTEDFTSKLQEGADKLTLADQNEEAAKLTTLQTRQQLGTTGLSIANQSQQAVLSLF